MKKKSNVITNLFHIINILYLGDYIYGPSSEEAAATINTLTKAFCREYPINQEALSEGKSGIVIGRYPGDGYARGNPWQLLTAVLGETFYLGAEATLKNIEKKGNYHLSMEENKEWIKLLDSNNGKKNYIETHFQRYGLVEWLKLNKMGRA